MTHMSISVTWTYSKRVTYPEQKVHKHGKTHLQIKFSRIMIRQDFSTPTFSCYFPTISCLISFQLTLCCSLHTTMLTGSLGHSTCNLLYEVDQCQCVVSFQGLPTAWFSIPCRMQKWRGRQQSHGIFQHVSNISSYMYVGRWRGEASSQKI